LLIGYHVRLAYRSLIRDRAFSTAMVLCLALAASIWGAAAAHYLRLHERPRPLSPHAHAVQAARTGAAFAGTTLLPGDWRRQAMKLSWPEFLSVKAAANVPISGNYRAWFLVKEGEQGLRRQGRFVDTVLWQLFPRAFAFGQAWSSRDERLGTQVVVLSRALNRRVFGGGNSVGRQLTIEGRPFTVVGVLAAPQPFTPVWDMSSLGGDEDQLLLPMALVPKLQVRPEFFSPQAPVGRSFEDLLASSAPLVSVWANVAPAARETLAQELAAVPIAGRLHVSSAHEVFASFPRPPDAAGFFALLCALVLIMGGFSTTRLLFAKCVARHREIGVHRALGASRSSLFLRTMIESAMVSGAGALLSLPLLLALLWFFNFRHLTNDIPLMMTPSLLLTATVPSFCVGVLAGLYPAWRVARARPTLYLSRV
jgi:putative ABC transport system permease protein